MPENTPGHPVASLATTEITNPKTARFSWHFFLSPHVSSLNSCSWMLPSLFEVEAVLLWSPRFWLLLFPYRSKVLCASSCAPAETPTGNQADPKDSRFPVQEGTVEDIQIQF